MTRDGWRVLWLALAAWIGTGAGWALPAGVAVLGGLAVLAAASVVARRSNRFAAAIGVVALGGTIVAAVGSGARQPPEFAVDHTVELTAQVRGPGRTVATQLGRPPARVVPVAVRTVGHGDTTLALDLPARFFIDAADQTTPLPVGTVIRCHGRMRVRDPTATEPSAQVVGAPVVIANPGPIDMIGDALRRGVATATGDEPRDATALVAGIAIGDESRQTPGFASVMQTAGLSHVTAVSGGNFVVVMSAVLLCLRLGRRSLRVQVAGAALVVAAYGALVGAQPSVLRAAVMAFIGLVGVLLGGPGRGFPLLGSCVTVLLLASPELAWSLGFVLSVAATAALQVVAPKLLQRTPRQVPRVVALPLAVACAAHVATAPVLLAVGAPVSWVAIPANLLAGAWIAPITILGLLAAIVSPLNSTVGAVAGHVAVPLAQVVVWVAQAADVVSRSAWTAGAGPPLLLAGTSVTVWCLITRRHGPWPATATTAAVLIVGTVVCHQRAGPPGWRLAVCDVGQGTAVLVRTGTTAAVMFDAGPDEAAVGCATRMGIRTLDAVVLSHYHADHVGGLTDVLAAYPGTPVVATAFQRPVSMAAAVTADVGAPGPVVAGAVARWPQVEATVLWPPAGFRGGDDEANNGSVVTALRWSDGFSALVPGDIEPESQGRLIAATPAMTNDVVVIPHHGSDHQDPRFAAWSAPRLGVASVGLDNRYGHPAPQTLAEYEAVGAAVWRTDTQGCVSVGGAPGAPWTAPC